jgi:hypothetical protein
MDTKAISKAARKLAQAEARLVRVVENQEAAEKKAADKYETKIAKSQTAVVEAKAVLSKLVSEA